MGKSMLIGVRDKPTRAVSEKSTDDSYKSFAILTWRNAAIMAATIFVLLLPQTANPYYVKVAAIGLIFAYISSAWNIIGGYGGQLSLGHSIFFGIGSYTFGLFSIYKIAPLIYAVPIGMALSFVAAAAIAAICFKYSLRGLYFAVGTLLLAEVVRLIAINWEPLGRSQGLSIVVEPGLLNLKFQSTAPLYYIISAAVAGIIILSYWLQRSRLGFNLIALREQEDSAQALGIDTNKVKRNGFVLSAVLTSIGGSLHAALIGYVDPNFDLSLTVSLIMVMGALLGGRGTIWGPIVGGFLVEVIQEGLGYLGSAVGTAGAPSIARMVYGLFFVVIILLFPLGIVGSFIRRRAERHASLLKKSQSEQERHS
jgi:branched-chain amino acid transport system permease protein